MTQLKIPLFVVLCVCVCTTAHGTITLYHTGLVAQASDADANGDGIPKSSSYDETTIPTVPDPFHLEVTSGGSYSKNKFNWSVVGDQTVFSIDTTQNRIGTFGASSDISFQEFVFISSETVTFELTGFVNVTDAGENESGKVRLMGAVYDMTTGETLAINDRGASDQPDLQLRIGRPEYDDVSAPFIPKLTGTIVGGHTIWFWGDIFLKADNPDSGASAVGNITLKIGTVPEPSSVALCSLFAVLGLIRRRQIV